MAEKLQRIYDEATQQYVSVLQMPDGRQVAIERRGHRNGIPIIGFHGSPGSRIGPWPRSLWLNLAGIDLTTFDRPGYGFSDRKPGRSVRDTASDVEQIADALGIERFGVNARSGGVPHALGCAALLRDRVANVVAMVGIAPRDSVEEWGDGMTEYNKQAHAQAMMQDIGALEKDLEPQAQHIKENNVSLLNFLEPSLTEADMRLVGSGPLRSLVADAHAQGLRADAAGWIDDTLAANRPWGFALQDIIAPTIIWHGEHDPFVPIEHAESLAAQIKHATLTIQPNASHFSNLQVLPESLAWQRNNFEY